MEEHLSHSGFENLQIFSINSEVFGSKVKVLRCRNIKILREEIR